MSDYNRQVSSLQIVGRVPRHTLVPSGFERVAHPIFFSYDDDDEANATRAIRERGQRRRRLDESAWLPVARSSPDTLVREYGAPVVTSSSSRNDSELTVSSALEDDDLDDEENALNPGKKGSRGGHQPGERELDIVCPICLERRQTPVTLTSCLHTFCHACILAWYQHTVAVALRRGDFSPYQAQGSDITGISNGRARADALRRPPAPYRCPLCQVPGPYFLSVEPARPKPSKSRPEVKEKGPKLKFKLIGARTVFGGGGPGSGGVEVERADGEKGFGYPSMAELRAAARTQIALAAAVFASEEKTRTETYRRGRRDGGGRRQSPNRHRGSTITTTGDQDSHESSTALEEQHTKRDAPNSPSGTRAQNSGPRGKGAGQTKEIAPLVGYEDSIVDGRSLSCSSRGVPEDGSICGAASLYQSNPSVDAFRGVLPWEPGAMTAEDALEAIEAMLAQEKEKLNHRRSLVVGSSKNEASSVETR